MTNVLVEADGLINGDRAAAYGDALVNHQNIADLWSGYLGREVSALDVANLMVLMKVARAKRGWHRDSYVDIAGYAGVAEKINDIQSDGMTNTERAMAGKPRQWEKLSDVSDGVYVVEDNLGRSWYSYLGKSYWLTLDGPHPRDTREAVASEFGPFTEVPQ